VAVNDVVIDARLRGTERGKTVSVLPGAQRATHLCIGEAVGANVAVDGLPMQGQRPKP